MAAGGRAGDEESASLVETVESFERG